MMYLYSTIKLIIAIENFTVKKKYIDILHNLCHIHSSSGSNLDPPGG